MGYSTIDFNVNLLESRLLGTNLLGNFKQMTLERIYLIQVVPKTDATVQLLRTKVCLKCLSEELLLQQCKPCLRKPKVYYLLLGFEDVFGVRFL